MSENSLPQQRRQTTYEQLWLMYYNDTLFVRGLITEEQRNRLRMQIRKHTASSQH